MSSGPVFAILSEWDVKSQTRWGGCSHYLEEADALADRIGIVDEGTLIALGTPAELKNATVGAQATVVEAPDIDEAAIDALRALYPGVTVIDGGIQIEGDDVRLHDIEDCLRPRGVPRRR